MRHAGATTLRVAAWAEAYGLHVTIDDDVRGMPARGRREGLGLESMQARVEAHGGTPKMKSAEPQGTRVEATLPRTQR